MPCLDTLPNEGKEWRGIDARNFRNVPCVSVCVWGTWWRPQAGKTHTTCKKKGPLDTAPPRHPAASHPRLASPCLLSHGHALSPSSLMVASTQPTDTHAPPIHFYPQEGPNHDDCHSRPAKKKKTHRRCPHCCCCHLPCVGQWGHGLYRACVLAFSQHLVLIPAAKLCGRDDGGPPGGW